MEYQYCNTIFSGLKSLKKHQETLKKCLTLRGFPPR